MSKVRSLGQEGRTSPFAPSGPTLLTHLPRGGPLTSTYLCLCPSTPPGFTSFNSDFVPSPLCLFRRPLARAFLPSSQPGPPDLLCFPFRASAALLPPPLRWGLLCSVSADTLGLPLSPAVWLSPSSCSGTHVAFLPGWPAAVGSVLGRTGTDIRSAPHPICPHPRGQLTQLVRRFPFSALSLRQTFSVSVPGLLDLLPPAPWPVGHILLSSPGPGTLSDSCFNLVNPRPD